MIFNCLECHRDISRFKIKMFISYNLSPAMDTCTRRKLYHKPYGFLILGHCYPKYFSGYWCTLISHQIYITLFLVYGPTNTDLEIFIFLEIFEQLYTLNCIPPSLLQSDIPTPIFGLKYNTSGSPLLCCS